MIFHTHRDNNTEETTNYPIHDIIQFFIRGLGTVQCPVGVLFLHSESEKIGLGDNEIQILVV